MTNNRSIALVVAMDQAGGIGFNNGVPWTRMRADMQRFRDLTLGGSIIMGRKTWDSLGGRLKGRQNIVVTRDEVLLEQDDLNGVRFVGSLAQAIWAADDDVFIIGGSQIYAQALPLVDTIYLTRVQATLHHCDAFFPEIDWTDWDFDEIESGKADAHNDYPYTFARLTRAEAHVSTSRPTSIEDDPDLFRPPFEPTTLPAPEDGAV